MPNQRVHRWITKLFLGKPHTRVHRAIDKPYRYLGRKHRALFHGPLSAALVAASASKDRDAWIAGILHVLAYKACSRDRRIKELLEIFANYGAGMSNDSVSR